MLHHLLNLQSQTNRGSPNNNETWYPWHLREAHSHRQQVPAFLIRYSNQRHKAAISHIVNRFSLNIQYSHQVLKSNFKMKPSISIHSQNPKIASKAKYRKCSIIYWTFSHKQQTEVHPITMKLNFPDIYERPIHIGNRSLLF